MMISFILELSLQRISGAKRITGYTRTIKSASCPDAIRAAHSKQEQIGPGPRNWNEAQSDTDAPLSLFPNTDKKTAPLLPHAYIQPKSLICLFSIGYMFSKMKRSPEDINSDELGSHCVYLSVDCMGKQVCDFLVVCAFMPAWVCKCKQKRETKIVGKCAWMCAPITVCPPVSVCLCVCTWAFAVYTSYTAYKKGR